MLNYLGPYNVLVRFFNDKFPEICRQKFPKIAKLTTALVITKHHHVIVKLLSMTRNICN